MWNIPVSTHPEIVREDLAYVLCRLNHAAPVEHQIYERLSLVFHATRSATAIPAVPAEPQPKETRKDAPDHDPVNYPSHYTTYKGLEVIDLTEQMNFNRGNAIKYVARAGLKPDGNEVEDLEKAVWYLNREIERIKANSAEATQRVLKQYSEAMGSGS